MFCPFCELEGITKDAKIDIAYADAGPDAGEVKVAVCDRHGWQEPVEAIDDDSHDQQ